MEVIHKSNELVVFGASEMYSDSVIRSLAENKHVVEAYAYNSGKRFKKRETFHGTLLANGTKNLILQMANKIINYGKAQGLIDGNPLASIKKWKTSPRLVELSRDEESRLLEACKAEAPHLYPALMFSMRNPIRIGDLRALTRKNLDIQNMTITYKSEKTSVTAVCNIYPELEKYFRNIPEKCDYLFYYKYKYRRNYLPLGDFKKSWNAVKKLAKVNPDLRWHDLRHYACTFLLKQGVPTSMVQKVGGWKSLAMVELYNTGNSIEAARLARECVLRGIKQSGAIEQSPSYKKEAA